VIKIRVYEELYVLLRKESMTRRWEYLLIAKINFLNNKVPIKIKILTDDDNRESSYAKLYILESKSLKFNKMLDLNFYLLFGSEEPPEWGSENEGEVPEMIQLAVKRMINICESILSEKYSKPL